MGHCQTRINTTSPKMSEATIVEIRKQPAGIKVIQSFNVIIITTWLETVVAPNTNVVRGGVLIGFATNLGCGLSRVLAGRNLSRSLGLSIATTRVVGTPYMVFTNPIMTTHENKIVD
jgi:hypothetical protein